ncbi:uncharacterized [Tachysurus ichikawai]
MSEAKFSDLKHQPNPKFVSFVFTQAVLAGVALHYSSNLLCRILGNDKCSVPIMLSQACGTDAVQLDSFVILYSSCQGSLIDKMRHQKFPLDPNGLEESFRERKNQARQRNKLIVEPQ